MPGDQPVYISESVLEAQATLRRPSDCIADDVTSVGVLRAGYNLMRIDGARVDWNEATSSAAARYSTRVGCGEKNNARHMFG